MSLRSPVRSSAGEGDHQVYGGLGVNFLAVLGSKEFVGSSFIIKPTKNNIFLRKCRLCPHLDAEKTKPVLPTYTFDRGFPWGR